MSDYLLLPPEIWYQILTKLPVKSVLQCRSVSKTWYSLISSPDFISDHTAQALKHSTRNRVLVHTCAIYTGQCKFSSHDESFSEFSHEHDDVPQPLLSPRVEIIGCCAGLVCLSETATNKGMGIQRFIFWNPSIRKLVKHPFRSSSSSRVRYLLGFGFDSNSGDFKVLRVVYRRSRDLVPTLSEIFDMRKGVWRRLSPPVTPSPFRYGKRCSEELHYHSCADLNGALHWMGNEYSSSCFILSFNLSSEVFRVMETPDGIEFKEDEDYTKVLSFNGLLSVALLTKQQQGHCFSVWSMNEYGNAESWTKLFRIQLPTSLNLSTVFGFREKGGVLILPLGDSDKDFEDLVLYNLESRKSKVLLPTNGFVYSVLFYVESLVLP